MHAFGLPPVATALRHGKLIGVTLCPSAGFERLAITGGHDSAKTEVNADRFV
jgi:hypothetical protein